METLFAEVLTKIRLPEPLRSGKQAHEEIETEQSTDRCVHYFIYDCNGECRVC